MRQKDFASAEASRRLRGHRRSAFDFRLSGDNTIGKTDPLVLAVKEQVDALYAAGRNTVMGDEELEIMVRNSDVDRYERLLFHKSH